MIKPKAYIKYIFIRNFFSCWWFFLLANSLRVRDFLCFVFYFTIKMLFAPHDVCAMLSSSLRCRAIYMVFNWVEFELSLSCIRIGVGTYKCAAPANWDRQASHAVFMSRRLAVAFRFKWGVINYGPKEGIFSQNKTLSLNVRSSISTAAKELSISHFPSSPQPLE